MRKLILLSTWLLTSISAFAETKCFFSRENDQIIKQEGDCTVRYNPSCSFNIALSLMGFSEGILIDQALPEIPFQEGYLSYVNSWKQPHNPALWMKNSCVWFSYVLTEKLGMARFKEYVERFNYGTQDVSGEKNQDNGLTRSWMSGGSLKISAEEQVVFLENFLKRNLHVSPESYEMTRSILFINSLENGWNLYGKTGTGNLPLQDGTLDENRQGGWFVGWIEKDELAIVFAHYVEQDSEEVPAGRRAREIAIEKLLEVTQENN